MQNGRVLGPTTIPGSSPYWSVVRAATYCEPANSTKSPEVDLDIYQDKANRLSASVGDLTIEFELDG